MADAPADGAIGADERVLRLLVVVREVDVDAVAAQRGSKPSLDLGTDVSGLRFGLPSAFARRPGVIAPAPEPGVPMLAVVAEYARQAAVAPGCTPDCAVRAAQAKLIDEASRTSGRTTRPRQIHDTLTFG